MKSLDDMVVSVMVLLSCNQVSSSLDYEEMLCKPRINRKVMVGWCWMRFKVRFAAERFAQFFGAFCG
jgi:hypothetical protein